MDEYSVAKTDAARSLMTRYFTDLDDGDAARHLTQDVVWVNEETGERITGPAAVINFVRALHERMADLKVRKYIVGEDAAMVEGDCLPPTTADGRDSGEAGERLPFVVVYDLAASGIAAMRLYMSITRLPLRT